MMIVKSIFAALLVCSCSLASGSELITNGGFELGATGWVLSSGASVVTSSNAQSGSSYLSIATLPGVYQTNYQTITVPSGTVQLLLDYYYNIYRTDGSSAQDGVMAVYIADAAGNPLTNSFEVYNDSADSALGIYHHETYDLTAFKDTTSGVLQIQFIVGATTTAIAGATTFSIDDISVTALSAMDRPANDNFTNRTVITGTNISIAATNTYATKETGEPNHAGNSGGASVWWSWTAPVAGNVVISTAGSTFDTLLAVYTGSAVSSLSVVASNNNVNSSNYTSKVAFKAAAGTDNQIAVDGTNGATGTIILSLTLTSDTKAPTISFSSPGSGAKVTSSTLTVTGKASDNIAVAYVEYRLENADGTNDYQTATGTNTWSATVTNLIPGINTVRARAYDTSLNVSATATRSFNYIIVSPLTISTTGSGTISPAAYASASLEVGKMYTVTAKPATGYIFSNWTDSASVLTNGVKLTFTMTSNLVLYANFVPNPFSGIKGSYAGLFYPTNAADIAHTDSGFLALTLADKGSFSSKIQVGGVSRSLSGQFDAGGFYSNSMAWPGLTSLSIQLQLDLTGGVVLSGTLSGGSWLSALTANHAIYSSSLPASQGGTTGLKYTLAISGASNTTVNVSGYGAATLKVSPSGIISFSGTLADGTKVSQATFVSPNAQWPLYLPLYSGSGCLFGWLTFTNSTDNSPAGPVTWLKLPTTKTKLYQDGFAFLDGLTAFGSLYTFTSGTAILPLNNGAGSLTLSDGDLPSSFSADVTLDSQNKFSGASTLKLKVSTSTGLFQGTVVDTDGTSISLNGASAPKPGRRLRLVPRRRPKRPRHPLSQTVANAQGAALSGSNNPTPASVYKCLNAAPVTKAKCGIYSQGGPHLTTGQVRRLFSEALTQEFFYD